MTGREPGVVSEPCPLSGRPRLLVVEDDEIQREVLRRWLDADYELQDAETGTVALALLPIHDFAGVLLDYRLPDYTGLELLPGMTSRGLPVLMFTSLADEDLAQQALSLGAQAYLAKDSLTREGLSDSVAKLLAQKKTGR